MTTFAFRAGVFGLGGLRVAPHGRGERDASC